MEREGGAGVIGHAEQWNTSSSYPGVLPLEITSIPLQNVAL